MNTESYNSRFGGIRRLYGADAQARFANAHVCVIGIGGVGSWAAEALARTGIGRITLIDLDDVCVTNTNRQLHALKNTIGESKCEVMAERIRAINPECQCEIIEDFVTQDNVRELIDRDYDFVLDAIDSYRVKASIIACCKRNKIPVVTVGAAGGQVDPTLIRVADLTKTIQDPLARKMKDQLRRFHNFPKSKRFGVECIYSEEAAVYPQPDGSVCQQKPSGEGSMKMDCSSGFGAATVVTATFGFFAVSRILRKLAG
ncbi:tRNA cyclic N6-threonylcarbamoyladenosine(37) synthase TcdA [Endozoicomonadaceae bacterium StTr2]